jgi:hypothetical protein
VVTVDASGKWLILKGWLVFQVSHWSFRSANLKGHFMSSTQIGLNSNFFNKSQLIREVSRAIPGMTNKQVKKIIRDQYGIEVASNLVIAVLGKERTRKLLAPVRSKLVQLGMEWFELCGRDRAYCSELLNSFR